MTKEQTINQIKAYQVVMNLTKKVVIGEQSFNNGKDALNFLLENKLSIAWISETRTVATIQTNQIGE